MIVLKEGNITFESIFRDAKGKDYNATIKIINAIYSFEIEPIANRMKTEDTIRNFKIKEWEKIEIITEEEH